MRAYFFVFLVLTFLFSASLSGQSPIIDTQYGQVSGNDNDGVYEFLGIPFASPPIEALRWRPPAEPISWEDVLQTQAFKPKCPQKNFTQGDTTATIEGSEDCLYLNVWTPDTGTATLPVMIFIHGGGNQQGSAAEFSIGTEIYNGKNMSDRGNVVVVTIQYRLGPLGFLVHPGLEFENVNNTSGNYAVMDQILALEWVQNNISNFGGDPSKVMIFGESAGGVNVGNLLTTSEATGLFSRACIQSAVPNIQDYEEAKDFGIEFADNLSNSGNDIAKIAFMRSLPPETIIQSLESPLNGGFVQSKWKPVVDHYLFEGKPNDIFQSGDYNKVPVIIGSNADESSLSAPSVVLPITMDAIINLIIPLSLRPQAHELYPSGTTAEEAKKSYIQFLTDAQFTATTRRAARCLSQNQAEPVFRYFFTHSHAGFLGNYGAYHGIELFYVFNNWENSTFGGTTLYTSQDDSVQNNMLQYWVNFAANGNPNGNGLPEWPTYGSEPDCYLEIKPTPDGNLCGLRTEKSDFWDTVIGFEGCTTSVASEDIDLEDPFGEIFPNPTTGIVILKLKEERENFEISIFDATGRLLFKKRNEPRLDISGYPNGVYFFIIKTEQQVVSRKLIKE